jgi:hypothetical protein
VSGKWRTWAANYHRREQSWYLRNGALGVLPFGLSFLAFGAAQLLTPVARTLPLLIIAALC